MKPPSWTERRERILAHIGRYRVTLRVALEQVAGVDPGNDIEALRAERLIRKESLGGLSLYQLTLAGAHRSGFPRDRAGAFGPRALLVHLAVLWFCVMSGKNRLRLETRELRELLGETAPNVDQSPHYLEEGPEGGRLYHVFVLGQRADQSYILKTIENEIDATLRAGGERAFWLKERLYGYVILTELESRLRDVRAAVEKSRLLERAQVLVHFAPGPKTLRSALNADRATRPASERRTRNKPETRGSG